MIFKIEFKKLQRLHKEKRYFEVISKGVQFIDYFASKLIEKIPIDDIEKYNDIDEIEAHTGYKFDRWIDLKKEIAKGLYKDESWKYKIFQFLDQNLEPWMGEVTVSKN